MPGHGKILCTGNSCTHHMYHTSQLHQCLMLPHSAPTECEPLFEFGRTKRLFQNERSCSWSCRARFLQQPRSDYKRSPCRTSARASRVPGAVHLATHLATARKRQHGSRPYASLPQAFDFPLCCRAAAPGLGWPPVPSPRPPSLLQACSRAPSSCVLAWILL